MKREVTHAPGETSLKTPAEALPEEPGEWVVTEAQWSGDREGKLTLLLPADGAKEIVAAMLTVKTGETKAVSDTRLDAEGIAAYNEALSQFLGQAAQTLRQEPGGEVDLSALPENTRIIDFADTSREEVLGSEALLCSQGQLSMGGSTPTATYTFMDPALAALSPGASTEAAAGEASATSSGAAQDHAGKGEEEAIPLSRLKGLKLPVQITLAEKKERLKTIMDLVPGSIVEFKKSAEEYLDMRIGKITIARGEAVIVDERFGLQIREIVDVLAEIKKQQNA